MVLLGFALMRNNNDIDHLKVSKSHIYAPPQISLSLCYQFKSRYNKLALLALIRLHVLNQWAVASAAKVLSEPGGEVYS